MGGALVAYDVIVSFVTGGAGERQADVIVLLLHLRGFFRLLFEYLLPALLQKALFLVWGFSLLRNFLLLLLRLVDGSFVLQSDWLLRVVVVKGIFAVVPQRRVNLQNSPSVLVPP